MTEKKITENNTHKKLEFQKRYINGKEKSNSGLAMALKIYIFCFLYLFSYEALGEIVQGLVDTSCLEELGENTMEYIDAIILCANMY